MAIKRLTWQYGSWKRRFPGFYLITRVLRSRRLPQIILLLLLRQLQYQQFLPEQSHPTDFPVKFFSDFKFKINHWKNALRFTNLHHNIRDLIFQKSFLIIPRVVWIIFKQAFIASESRSGLARKISSNWVFFGYITRLSLKRFLNKCISYALCLYHNLAESWRRWSNENECIILRRRLRLGWLLPAGNWRSNISLTWPWNWSPILKEKL